MLIGAWLGATALATLVAWGAVRQVTAEVSPTAVLPVPSAVAIADDVSEQGNPANPPAAGGQANGQPRDPEAGNDPQAEPATTEAYELAGGVVTVRYVDGTARLVSAAPTSGFDVDVNDGGPDKVDVRFRSDAHESRLVARWRGGAPDAQRDERSR
jgi:hypothetical protein